MKRAAKILIILYVAIPYIYLKLFFNNIVINTKIDIFNLVLALKLDMAAAAGRRPLAQVLRNSLSEHPPSPASTRGLRDTDTRMAAGAGRRPLAQVLRNSLSGHPPSSATAR